MRIQWLVVMIAVVVLHVGANAQQRVVTADGRVVILNPDGTWKHESPAPKTSPAAPMTSAQKVAAWNGEKVVLLIEAKQNGVTGSGRFGGTFKRGEPEVPLRADRYGGKIGTVIETDMKPDTAIPNRLSPYVVVRLDDTGEEIIFNPYGYGFVELLKIAEAFVGRPLWTKGRSLPDVPPGTPVKVAKASWGSHGVVLDLQFPNGVSGSTPFSPALFGCAGDRYNPSTCDSQTSGTVWFYARDPRSLFPTWTPAIWRKIESWTIDAGMTFEMVQGICGDDLRRVGGQWVEEKKLLTDVYECQGKKMMVANGRVLEWKDK